MGQKEYQQLALLILRKFQRYHIEIKAPVLHLYLYNFAKAFCAFRPARSEYFFHGEGILDSILSTANAILLTETQVQYAYLLSHLTAYAAFSSKFVFDQIDNAVSDVAF